MTTGNPLIRHFTKPPALKKIDDPFSKPFAMSKTEEPCMIAGIPLMNQKWSIADLETQNQSSDPESGPRTRKPNLEPWIRSITNLWNQNPEPRTTNESLDVKLDVKRSKNRLKQRIIWIAHLKNLVEDLHA